jgi:hypothetical protein
MDELDEMCPNPEKLVEVIAKCNSDYLKITKKIKQKSDKHTVTVL